MIILGVLLLAAVAVVVVAAVASGDEPATLGLVGANIDTSVRWIFLTGAVSVLALVVGVSLLRGGLRRARARSKEMKHLKAAAGPAAAAPERSVPARGSTDQHQTPPIRRPVSPQDPDEKTHFESAPRE